MKTNRNYLIGIAHHSDKHVDEHNDHDCTVDAEHEQPNEHSERMLAVERVETVFLNIAEHTPIQSLQCFEQA